MNVGTLGAVNLGGHGPLQDIGNTIGGVRRKVAGVAGPLLTGGMLSGDMALKKGGQPKRKGK